MTHIQHALMILSNSFAKTRTELIYNGEDVPFQGLATVDLICGFCGRTLCRGVEKLPLINFCFLCKNCNHFNDLTKLQLFNKRAILTRDTENIERPMLRFVTNSFWLEQTFSQTLLGISDKIVETFFSYQAPLPTIVQHYTSYAGLVGIIASNAVWATDIAFMNDSSELTYGKNMINSYLDEVTDKLSNEPVKELLKNSRVLASTESTSSGYYVCCFCEDADLLSQWRAYGAGGSGYSLGFSVSHIETSQKLYFRKVIYNQKIQESLVKQTVDLTLLEFMRYTTTLSSTEIEETIPYFAAFLANHFDEYLFTFKHSAFQEENEVRLIYKFDRENDLAKISFRNYNSIPIPYLNLKLGSENPDLPLLPIVQLKHGPTLQPELTKKAVHLLLEKYNYLNVNVSGSVTPLRI